MTSSLRNILGFKVNKTFEELKKVGDLLYFDGPLMSVYKDDNNCPYIFDWAESDEEINRWLVYQLDYDLLSDYIFKKATHTQLLNSPKNNIIFVVDLKYTHEQHQCFVISPAHIPIEYIPQVDTFFEEEDSKNLQRIIDTFSLKENKNFKQNKEFNIFQEAKQHSTELINLHFKSKTRNVGYGRIYSSLLGDVLSDFQKLSEAIALNLFDEKGKQKNDYGISIRRKKGELKELKELGEFEYLYSKAASFSIFLRPVKINRSLFTQDSSSSEDIVRRIFKLFSYSKELDSLREMEEELSEDMISSYSSLMKEIKDNDISLTIQYANPSSGLILRDKFDIYSSKSVLKNLEKFEIQYKDDINPVGTFKALDSISNSFKFEDSNGNVYNGKFDELLKESIYYFNLKDSYDTKIEVTQIKKSGENKLKEKSLMTSCIKIDK